MTTAPKDATKDGKIRTSLLPDDLLQKYLVVAYEEGVIKYHRESWRKGFKVSEMMDALDRHKEKFFKQGEDIDQETLEKFGLEKTHLAAMIFCCLSTLHTLEHHTHLDDRRSPVNGKLLFITEEEEEKNNEA